MAWNDRVRRFLNTPRVLRVVLPLVFVLTPVLLTAQYGDPQVPGYDRSPQDVYPVNSVDDQAYDDVPAHVAVVDGEATIERDGRREVLEENVPLLAGDRLRTERGRVEVLFSDGSAIDIDFDSTVDFLSDSLIRLSTGRIRLAIARANTPIQYRVDAAATSSWIQMAGEYRITIRNSRAVTPEVELVVLRGQAELETSFGRTRVRTGQQAYAVATSAPSTPYVANASSYDDFDRWAEDQLDARLGVQSTRYLPAEVRYYGGAFDNYGSWDYLPTYGHVWYPRVSPGWRPYSHGKWSFYASFGWTWIGFDRRWGWPTHHYGRWGLSAGRWYWIPGRRWAPAWVSWGHHADWVSWCPLGFDGRPVIQITNINIRTFDPWRAWTVVPSRSFVHNVTVARYAVAAQTAANVSWSNFVVRNAAPIRPANVGSRVAPIRAPTYRGQAVPRDSGLGPLGVPPSRLNDDAANSSRSRSAVTGRDAVPEWRSSVDRDGATRVTPESAARSRVPSSSGATSRPELVAPPAGRTGPYRAPQSTPSRDSRSAVTNPDAASDNPRTRSRAAEPYEPPAAVSRRDLAPPESVSPSRRGAPPSRSDVAPPSRNDNQPAYGTREVMPAPSSRVPSRIRSYEPPSAPPPSRPDNSGGAIARPRSMPSPPSSESAPSRAPSGWMPAPGRSRSSEAPPPPPSSESRAPSRMQPRSEPSAPPPQAAPSRRGGGEERQAPPPSSNNRGQAVRRGGG